MPLTALPADIGSWRWVGIDHPLDADVQAMLGTDQYIFRTYLDEREISAEKIAMRCGAGPTAKPRPRKSPPPMLMRACI